jgi:FtsH-binding integral membrane protein
MFGAAAIYGKVTQRSLAKLGGILFMGIIGLLVAMLLNFFLRSSEVTFVISIVGVVLFTALTAYDVQRIQSGDLAARLGSMEKAAVVGALQLYLDFVNLFLFMLRLLGSR